MKLTQGRIVVEPGFYWVQDHPNDEWTVARFEEGRGRMHWASDWYTDNPPYLIGPKVEPPQ
jgi:hypothetical protein